MNYNNYIITFTGKKFHADVEGVDLDEIDIIDIAAGLSKMCRFSGQISEFYSVAQHSLHVAYLMWFDKQGDYAREGLMHDASEAYIADIAKPWKNILPDYNLLERKIMQRVMKKYNLRQHILECEVKKYDLIALATEKRDLKPHACEDWPELEGVIPDPIPIVPLSPEKAFHKFLMAYKALARV